MNVVRLGVSRRNQQWVAYGRVGVWYDLEHHDDVPDGMSGAVPDQHRDRVLGKYGIDEHGSAGEVDARTIQTRFRRAAVTRDDRRRDCDTANPRWPKPTLSDSTVHDS